MKQVARIGSGALTLSIVALCLLLPGSAFTGQAQNNAPITKDNLLSSLRLGKSERKPAARYIELIERYGVDFVLTSDDEQRISQAGSYLGEKGIKDLIAAVRNNYRPVGQPSVAVTLFQDEVPASLRPDMEVSFKVWREESLRDGMGVEYSFEKDKNTVHVKPDLPYLNLHHGEGVMEPRRVDDFSWPIPILSFLVANPTQDPLLISDIEVIVNSAKKNLEPILLINEPKPYVTGRDFSIYNNGWGRVIDASVKFAILPGGEAAQNPDTVTLNHEVKLGSFSEEKSFDVSPYIPPNIKRSKAPIGYEGKKPIAFAEYVLMVGKITYKTEDGNDRLVKFKTRIWFETFGPGQINPSYVYGINLDTDKPKYIVHRAIAQEIKPKATEHFLLAINSKTSAFFNLTFKLHTSDGRELISNDVQLDTLFPRNYGLAKPRAIDSVIVSK